jgi:hypothetical protein
MKRIRWQRQKNSSARCEIQVCRGHLPASVHSAAHCAGMDDRKTARNAGDRKLSEQSGIRAASGSYKTWHEF